MAARKEQSASKPEELGFEAALERLEALVRRMEAGEMGLDDMVGAFEEGQRLIKHCTRKLNEVERRIELLAKGADGGVEAESFKLADGTADKSP